jgi:hypothetical protein
MKLYYNIIVFILLLNISLISANNDFINGLNIGHAPVQYLKQNQSYTFSLSLHNQTDGSLLTNATAGCILHLSNSSGVHILESVMEYNIDNYLNFEQVVDPSYFINSGTYSVSLLCFTLEEGEGDYLYYNFEVSENGKPSPNGIIIVVYTLIFIAIFFFGLIYFFKALEKFITFEMDLLDTIILMGTYFSMWIFYYFCKEYLGNAFVNSILEIAINVGSVTHVFLPLVGFMIAFIMTTLKFKQKSRITY